MGNLARKFNRSQKPQPRPLEKIAPRDVIVLGPEYGNKHLTREEFNRLKSEVCAVVADEMVGDALLVFANILQNHIGKLYRNKNDRMKNFGEMFKPMFREQGKTHSLEFLDLIKRAGLVEIEYGE